MIEVAFHPLETVKNEGLRYAVIAAQEGDGWLFCRHRRRETWELPGGHREPGENIRETARRELWEETGASDMELTQVCLYSVFGADGPEQTAPNYGMLFYARVTGRGALPESEIAEVRALPAAAGKLPLPNTYPQIQPLLWERVQRFLEQQNG